MKLFSNRRSYEKRKRLPHNEKTRNPKVMAASLAAIVISAVIFCMVIVIGIVGFTSDEKVVSDAPEVTAEGPLHIWFFIEQNEIFNEKTSFEMSAPVVSVEGTGYIPADGIAAAMGGTYEYNKEKGTVKFKDIGKRVKLTVDSDAMKVGLLKTETLDKAVYMEEDTIYVPIRSFFDSLGYSLTFTEEGQRIDIFVPDTGEAQLPTASFSTDKDTYTVGEKVTYTTESQSPQNYEIVEEKWENQAIRYFEKGEVTITYSVKDYKGNWSEPVSKTITIEGEYKAAEEVPVLSYYYIVEDSAKISKKEKTVKEVKEKDPKDPTKVVVKKVEEEKLIKGPYYGDDMVISLDQFKKEMEYLAEEGIQTLTVAEYLEYDAAGVMPPKDSVVILFVNGYESTYTLAYPVLKELGLKANIAPEIKAVEDRSALVDAVAAEEEGAQAKLDEFDEEQLFPIVTFAQLKEMAEDGTVEVGSISYDSNERKGDSALLAAPVDDETEEQYAARVKDDVTKAITVLYEQIGEGNVPFFVYPYGETSDVLISAVQSVGFPAAFINGKDGYIVADSDPYRLERMKVTQKMTMSRFRGLF